MADLVANDTTNLKANLLKRDRTRLDLTGGSAELRWRIDGGARTDSSMTLDTPSSGIVSYEFSSGELTAGRLTADIVATTAAGKVYTNRDVLSFEVRKRN
jgi:hypothetical protein